MTSVGSIVGGAFGLVRRHPLAVIGWGLIYLAAAACLLFAMRPVIQVYSELIGQQLASGGGKPLPPEAMQPYIARMQSAGGIVFLAEIAMLAVMMVLFTATQRAVLRPAERGFLFLRAGMDELRMIGLGLILTVGLSIAMVMAMLALMLLVGIVLAITMAASGSPAVGIFVFVVAYVVLMGAMIYLEVRMSLAFPLTFLRREFAIGEAWRLTKGRFWTLFGAYFVIGLVYMALFAVLVFVAFGPFLSEVMQTPNQPADLRLVFENEMRVLTTPNPTSIALLVGGALLAGLSLALFGGAMATAARDLAPDGEAAAPAFQ